MSTTTQQTRWTMIERAAAGSADGRDRFAHCYLPVIRDFLRARWRRTPWETEVDDAVQEVFVQCFRARGALGGVRRDGRAFHSFLFGVASNVARQHERSQARRNAREAADGELPDRPAAAGGRGLSQVFDRALARSVVREAAELMRTRATDRARQRRVELLELRFEAGLPIREIARRWSVDAAELHREYAKSGREFRGAMREVLGYPGRGARETFDAECDRLLELLA